MSDDQYQWREVHYDNPETEGMSLEEKKHYVNANLWYVLEKVGKKISFAKDIRALWRYMNDDRVPWTKKSLVIGALIYFISPIDAIPDFIPIIGYLDDLGVIVALMKYLGKELIPYYD
jgi:uncharacterized membrane protein YkvA (DUF1232 family)